MIGQLKEMAEVDDVGASTITSSFDNLAEADSIMDYLLCTKPKVSKSSSTTSGTNVLGVSLLTFPPPSRLACLMKNYTLEIIPLAAPYFESSAGLIVGGKGK